MTAVGKIVFIMGKSAVGKDTIYRSLVKNNRFNLMRIIPYTTRPLRKGEGDGNQYRFCTVEDMRRMEEAGQILERRTYPTVAGDWHYFTADDGMIDIEGENYITIGTLESYNMLSDHFGKEKMIPIYVALDDGERLSRAVKRERLQKEPNYAELCRRYLADCEDFSDIKIKEAGINRVFYNMDLKHTVTQIEEYLEGVLWMI